MWIDPPIELASLPREPGVYRMLDGKRKALYVGKARNLRKRVSSYFQRQPESPRTLAMVQQIRDISISVTASEAEALVLEHNLIKQLKPRYNVLMKDSKSYPYILLTDEPYPRLQLYRGSKERPGSYFGPFPDAAAVHQMLHLMQSIFLIRDCENSVFSNRSRPCLQYQIGRCSAPCCQLASQKEYAGQIREMRAFLEGRDKELVTTWQKQMQQAAEKLDFELAARLRDRIKAIRTILAGSENSRLPEQADAIILLGSPSGTLACIGVRRGGRDLGTRHVRITQTAEADAMEILQFLLVEQYGSEPPPSEILIYSQEVKLEELKQTLRLMHPRATFEVKQPQRGQRLEWLKQVHHSGSRMLASRREENQQPAFEALAELLGLETTPERIAAVDNAHLGGQQTVAAITYAGWQGPEKELYRRYKLDDISASADVPEHDDYAAMQAVLSRFFRAISEETIPCPDLMLIDGGRGQLAVAMSEAADAGLHGLKLVGVAKGKDRRFGEERLWPGWLLESGRETGNLPLKPGRHSPALLLIARVRDEAHRFAGSYMRKRKKQAMFTSQLDGIPGIGPAKRAALLKHFGGIEGVKKASRAKLAQVPGISAHLAEQVFTCLHK